MAHSVLSVEGYATELSGLPTKESMQILFLPGQHMVIMWKFFFEPTEPFGVGHLAAITRFYSEIVMKHFMVNDAGKDIEGDIAPVQNRIDPDQLGPFRIAREFNGFLSANWPSGSPGYMAVYFVGKVILIDPIKKFLEVEVSPTLTENNSPRFGRRFSDFTVVRSNKTSQKGRSSLIAPSNKTHQ